MLVIPAIIATAVLLVGRAHAAPTTSSTEVDLGYTKYTGTTLGNGINQFLGIRFADAPTGDNRFKAPQPPKNFPPGPANKGGIVCHSGPLDINLGATEDCLFLDVYAPTKPGPHPVLVFIKGGGFNTQSPNMNASSLIEAGDHDIVVVQINYRVGPWGFLASKEIKAGGNLNAGLLDQRFALQWVQKNIDKFGGDPKHVTIDGASAGAASVNLHLTAYGGKDDGLFHAAIGESNSFGYQMTVDESQYQYDGLVKRTGCDKSPDTLKCLRGLDNAVIIKNNQNMPTPGGGGLNGGTPVFMYSNVIEGPGGFVEDYTYNAINNGKFVKVPTIFGGVSNEGTIFTPSNINSPSDMDSFLKNNWPKLQTGQLNQLHTYFPQVKSTFPGKGSWWATAALAYGDFRYNCPGVWLNKMVDTHGGGTTNWHYWWDVVSDANQKSGLGSTHTAEVEPIWGAAKSAPDTSLTPIISSYWASFIRSKDPNKFRAPGAPEWKTFGVEANRIHFPNDPKQVGMTTVDKGQLDRCQYYSVIGNMIGQ